MSSNSSRYSHQPARRYATLVLAQGAMVTDADQAESAQIQLRNTAELGDTAIRSGVPRTGGVLAYEAHGDPSAHRHVTGLQPGRVVADGLVGQVGLVAGAGPLPAGAGLDLLHLQRDLRGLSALTDTAGPYLLYADLWQRHVGVAEDARLVDPAFLSAETASRTELTAQLKIARLTAIPTDEQCRTLVQDALSGCGAFRLTAVDFESEVIAPDVCDPCATVLDDPQLDAGNHLFRLEVHASPLNRPEVAGAGVQPRDPGALLVTLKWSRDNGSIEVPLDQADALLSDSAFDTAVFELTDPVAEERLGLWTEQLTERRATLHSRAAIEAQLAAAPEGAFLRVWDGAVVIDLANPTLAPAPVGTLSATGSATRAAGDWRLSVVLGGLALDLAAPHSGARPFLLPGDAWLVEIREYADAADQRLIWRPEPVEAIHHYTWLGVINGGALVNTEMPETRSRAFPALTELEALDIRYDNAESGAQAVNVQGALDLLFAKAGDDCHCQCTVMIDPEKDLAAQLDELRGALAKNPALSALVCFPAGLWYLDRTVELAGMGSLVFMGAGDGVTLIETWQGDDVPALAFSGFARVRFQELSIDAMIERGGGDTACAGMAMTGVGRVEVQSASFSIRRSPAGLCHAISVLPTEGRATRNATVSLDDCHFLLGTGATALAIRNEAAVLRVTGCSFASGAQKQQGGGGGPIFMLTELLAQSEAVRKTTARELQVREGLYATFPGQDDLLIDLTQVPENARKTVADYWRVSLPLIGANEAPLKPEDFPALRATALELNEAAEDLREAQVLAGAASVRAGPQTITRRVLAGRGDLAATQALGRDLRKIGIGSVAGDIVSVGAGRLPGRAEPLPPGPGRKLDRVIAAADKLGRGKTLSDYLKGVDSITIPPRQTNSYPTIGVMCLSEIGPETWICGNLFDDLDAAIQLYARPALPPSVLTAASPTAVIADNRVIRDLRDQPVYSPGAPGFEDARSLPLQPITIQGWGDLTIRDNHIRQDAGDAAIKRLYGDIFGSRTRDYHPSWAAIALRGVNGPKLRVSGNAGVLFRHCIWCDCGALLPRGATTLIWQTAASHWILTDNSTMPVPYNIEETAELNYRARPGVEFGSVATLALNDVVRLSMRFNHPPNPKYEGDNNP